MTIKIVVKLKSTVLSCAENLDHMKDTNKKEKRGKQMPVKDGKTPN